EDLLEVEPRLLEIAHAGETLDVPEGAHAEGPLPAGDAVGEPVAEPIAVDQGVADQVLLDGMKGGDPAGVRRRDEPDQRHEERGGVERGRALGLDERLAFGVPEVGEDVAVDLVAHVVPANQWSRERALLRQAHRAVERRPAEHAREEELLAPAAHLPDALVLVAPVGADPVGEAEAHEAVEREGGVADPGVAIVPVPLAAELLGKPEGGGRDEGAVRPRGEELEGQRGAVDHLTPTALVGGATEPPAPEVDGAL